ncbi:hypothetical protein [Bordetella genomosp. 11]|uniref:DUF4239 domain-containing protein n=1 Tax=Bordetella genomosp. 11 TaxID=1416808 RepID=A0A261UZJ9_9BORD|nr:hypothetical protein [Bordetella genomosp. 11]OZI67299.1 hypothetical protein CAL28_06360 [Bordetella genomosp. 11]
MIELVSRPILFFVVSLLLMMFAAWIGVAAQRHTHLDSAAREDFGVVQSATLTLLALVIGFSLSMAVGRYDQRKDYEEEEANAIGTQVLRADLLPAAQAAQLRSLLEKYLRQRILYYQYRDRRELEAINRASVLLQGEMWAATRVGASLEPTPVAALVLSGMNDVINRQGYTQAEWTNRIPPAVWYLMILIGVLSNVLVGYGSRGQGTRRVFLFVMPVVVSLSFMLIADIDSPRGGIIRVQPQNLLLVAQSLPQP